VNSPIAVAVVLATSSNRGASRIGDIPCLRDLDRPLFCRWAASSMMTCG
jgi:hypothetical protein